MRFKEHGRDHDVEVFAIYWIEGRLHFFLIPYEGYEGFISVTEDDGEITNNVLRRSFHMLDVGEGGRMLVHPAIVDLETLNNLVDHDSQSMTHFLERLNQEEIPDPLRQ